MMGALHVLLISAIAVQMVLGEDALSESEVDRQARRPQNCDATTYSNRGIIYSPGYPSNYDNSLDCRTRIIPQISGRYNIRFYFCDFSTETGFIGCADSVKLGTSDKLCGYKSNNMYQYTSSGSFDVTFKSDRTVTKRGYKIAFCVGCANVADAKALCNPSSTTRRPLTRATTRRPLTRATTRRPLTRATTRRPLTRATTRKDTTTSRSRFTYPRHKRGFFFNKRMTTPSYFTYPHGGLTFPFTSWPHFTYPRHKRGFFFNKRITTPSYFTYPHGGFTFPFTFRYPHF